MSKKHQQAKPQPENASGHGAEHSQVAVWLADAFCSWCFLSELKQRPSCAGEDTLPNGISRILPVCNRCFAHGTRNHALDRRCNATVTTAYLHCLTLHRRMLPSPQWSKFLPALPRPPAGNPALEELHQFTATRTERRLFVRVATNDGYANPIFGTFSG